MALDLLPQDIQGPWRDISNHPSIQLLYPNLDLSGTYCWFNCQRFDAKKIPIDKYDEFVISFHTEYLEHTVLEEFFLDHPEKKFLLLTDWIFPQNIFPANVSTVQWLTLPHQISTIVKKYDYSRSRSVPTRRISSLASRHEFHKAAVTSYILEKVPESDRVLSWLDVRYGLPYYLQQDYYIDPRISKYVLSDSFKQQSPIRLDDFVNDPISNSEWRHPAYLDCVFNLTNESIFNNHSERGLLPYPYMTEKTWKVLLSGCGLLPVGQANTLEFLQGLGLEFNYNLDLSFDQVTGEYDRICGLYETIDVILGRDLDRLSKDTQSSGQHNIDRITGKAFQIQCESLNESNIPAVEKWLN